MTSFLYSTAVRSADFRLIIVVVGVTFDVSVRMRRQPDYFLSRRRNYFVRRSVNCFLCRRMRRGPPRAVDYFRRHVTRWRTTWRGPEVVLVQAASRHVDIEHKVVGRCSPVRRRG